MPCPWPNLWYQIGTKKAELSQHLCTHQNDNINPTSVRTKDHHNIALVQIGSSFANGFSFVLIMIINTTSRLHKRSSFIGPNQKDSMKRRQKLTHGCQNFIHRQKDSGKKEKSKWSNWDKIIIILKLQLKSRFFVHWSQNSIIVIT
jgi:hypothetical protein